MKSINKIIFNDQVVFPNELKRLSSCFINPESSLYSDPEPDYSEDSVAKPIELLGVFKNCDENYPDFRKNIKKVCLFIKNEAIVEDVSNNAYLINNDTTRVRCLSDMGIKDFVYSHARDNSSLNYHMMALRNDGLIYAWGKNEYNQVYFEMYQLK